MEESSGELETQMSRTDPLYETIAETAPIGLFVLDEAATITWANRVYADKLGLDREELVGTPFVELIEAGYYDEEVREGYFDLVETLLSSDEVRENYVVRTHLPSGETRTYDVYVSLLPSEDGEFRGTVQAFRDITTQKEYERELEEKTERLEEFASVVSHDLRNPLNVAEGRLELAMQESDSEHLEAVARAHDRMETLIADLLALAQGSDESTDTSAVGLAAVAEACWRTVVTEEATLAVETDRSVRADESRLRQLLENLFRNAVVHGGEDVTVTVGDLPDGFYVEDDGPGFPADAGRRVFESGYSTTPEGTGFGLSIVEQVAHGHGWEVRLGTGDRGGARVEFTGVDVVD